MGLVSVSTLFILPKCMGVRHPYSFAHALFWILSTTLWLSIPDVKSSLGVYEEGVSLTGTVLVVGYYVLSEYATEFNWRLTWLHISELESVNASIQLKYVNPFSSINLRDWAARASSRVLSRSSSRLRGSKTSEDSDLLSDMEAGSVENGSSSNYALFNDGSDKTGGGSDRGVGEWDDGSGGGGGGTLGSGRGVGRFLPKGQKRALSAVKMAQTSNPGWGVQSGRKIERLERLAKLSTQVTDEEHPVQQWELNWDEIEMMGTVYVECID